MQAFTDVMRQWCRHGDRFPREQPASASPRERTGSRASVDDMNGIE